MNKLKAIEAVVKNGSRCSEWAEAGLYNLVCEIIKSKETNFDSRILIEKIKQAENN